MRSRRLAAGLSLRQLAEKASLTLAARPPAHARGGSAASVSAPYISLIENGRKVPNQAVALALADALGDDPALYRAWIAARKRADLDTALAAAETLKRLLAGPGADAARADAASEAATAPARSTTAGRGPSDMCGTAATSSPSFTRLRVPVIREGADPGEGVRPACEVLEWRRLDASRLSDRDQARLDRPFALRPGEPGVRRALGLLAPDECALVLRAFLPLATDAVYAVRGGGRVMLGRVLWNGRQLLLLPAESKSDFMVLEAGDESRLRSLILGATLAVRFEPEDACT